MNPNQQWSQYQQPQQTGFQQPLYAQQTGFPQQQQQQQQPSFPRPPLPQGASGQYSFLNAPPPPSVNLTPQQTGWQPPIRTQATGWGNSAGTPGLVPQQTGWQGGGGQAPLMPQATGWHDPRLTMMSSSFMPMNSSAPFAQGGAPIFQQPSLPAGNLQSSMNLLNQTPSVKTPAIPWALTKDERKNYDQIFRAWDKEGTGFISGDMAREVFGQSGLGQDDMAQIWTLADMDNRGKLNIQEFHVAMALIYRRLNGNDMPSVLPPELVPASSKDLDQNVDFLKSLLRNDTNSRSTSTDPSYAKSRSFNSSPAVPAKKDGTVYKHDEDRDVKTYKSSSRHLDRASVRTGKESTADDLDEIKRQISNTTSRLDDRLAESERRSEEDEELDDEMDGLKRRVRRIQDDIEYVSSGRRTQEKDEERRKLERELLEIAHEKIPDVERRIAERDERKKREERDGVRARDRRNDRYGRYDHRERDREDDRGYMRGTYDRERDRSRDRYDSYDRDRRPRSPDPRDRDYYASPRSTRSPPPAPAPPAHSLAAPPAPPAPTSSPAPAAGVSREQRLADARARALQKLEDRKRALGLSSAEPETPALDTSVSERIEREKKEAEEAAKKAESERTKKEEDRRARLEAEKGGPPAPPPSSTSKTTAPDSPAPSTSKAAPPPPKPRSILKTRALAPAPPAPAAPPKAEVAPPIAAPVEEEEDPVERQLREREERLKKTAADRAARLAELERQEEEERKAEAEFEARRSSKAAAPTPSPAAEIAAPLAVPSSSTAGAASSPSASLGSHNPFAKFSANGASSPAVASVTSPASESAPAARPNPFFKPPTPAFTPPPIAAPVAKQPAKKAFVPPPAADDDWEEIEDKGNESDSSDDYDTAKRRKAELAKALFGGIMPSSSPAPASNPPSSSGTPAPGSTPTGSKNPLLAALGGGAPDSGARGGLFAAIQGGAKLKKTTTVDKSGPALAGAVVGGDAAPPAHISDVPRAISPPPRAPSPEATPAVQGEEDQLKESNTNRQSVDWYAGLAANGGGGGASEATTLATQAEEDEDEDALVHQTRQASISQGALDPMAGVDTTVDLRVRTLFSYDGQRPEDLSFTENVMIEAHPSSDPASPWYYGTLIKERKSGWFPSSYVAEVQDVVQAKALYSYTGSSDQEMPFVEGDVLTIVEHTNESWWKAVSDGIVFLVPAAYLELQG